jgi:hypothetical protein
MLASVLDRLAELTVRQLEAPWASRHPHLPDRRRALAAYDTATMLVDASQHRWKLLHLNPNASGKTGASRLTHLAASEVTDMHLPSPATAT